MRACKEDALLSESAENVKLKNLLARYTAIGMDHLQSRRDVTVVIEALLVSHKLKLTDSTTYTMPIAQMAPSEATPQVARGRLPFVSPPSTTKSKLMTRSESLKIGGAASYNKGKDMFGLPLQQQRVIPTVGVEPAMKTVSNFVKDVNLELATLNKKKAKTTAELLDALQHEVHEAQVPLHPTIVVARTLQIVLRVDEFKRLEEELPKVAGLIAQLARSKKLQTEVGKLLNASTSGSDMAVANVLSKVEKANKNTLQILDDLRSCRNQGNSTTLKQRALGLCAELSDAPRSVIEAGSRLKIFCAAATAKKLEMELFTAYKTIVLPSIRKFVSSKAFQVYSDNHVFFGRQDNPTHKQRFFSSLRTIMNGCRFLGDDFPPKSKINYPIVLSFDVVRSSALFKRVEENIEKSDTADSIFDKHEYFSGIPAAGTACLPSLSSTFPLEQLMGNYGTFSIFESKVMGRVQETFMDGGAEQPAAIFSCHDYEGDNHLSKLHVKYLEDDGSVRVDTENSALAETLQRSIQLIASFHLQKALLEGLAYNIKDLQQWVSPLMTVCGEVNKFKKHIPSGRLAPAQSARSTSPPVPSAHENVGQDTPNEILATLDDENGGNVATMHVIPAQEDVNDGGEETNNHPQARPTSAVTQNGNEVMDLIGDDPMDAIFGEASDVNDDEGCIPLFDDSNDLLEVAADEHELLRLFALVDEGLSAAGESKVKLLEEAVQLCDNHQWRTGNKGAVSEVRQRVTVSLKAENASPDAMLMNYVEQTIEMLKREEKISYTRLRHRFIIYWLAWESGRSTVIDVMQRKLVSKDNEESEENYLKRVCRTNAAIASMFAFFDRDLYLGIGVFRELRKGNTKNFLNALPRMTLHLRSYGKNLISSTVQTFLDTLQDLQARNVDVFEYVCANLAALTADEIQEFQNSRLGGTVHNPTNMSDEYLAHKSVLQKYLSSKKR